MSIEGRRIGQYQVLRRLGVGGMAEVYAAERIGPAGFRRAVALKVLRPHLRHAEAVTGRFTREARLAASLRHPNLVPVVDLGIDDGVAFLAMELVDGPDLRHATSLGARLGRPLPPRLAVYVGIQVARGLAYAHALGLVHRDVSPQNILLSRSGEVRLSDFGIAAAASGAEASASGALRGKLAYLAPEQVEGRAPDARADVFALGVVTWELLAGRRMFLGATDAETLARVRACQVPIPPPGVDADAVPPGIWAALGGALTADRAARTASAAAFAASLADAWPEADRGEATAELAAWIDVVCRHVDQAVRERERPAAAAPLAPDGAHAATPTLQTTDAPAGRPAATGPATAGPAARRRAWAAGALAIGLAAIALLLAARSRSPFDTAPPPLAAAAGKASGPERATPEPVAPERRLAPVRPRSTPEATAPARAEAVTRRGTLLVTSRPAGASIELDGRPAGRTPRRLAGLAPGTPVVVVVRLDGHRPVERTVVPRASGTETLDITLEPAFGLLSLDADPWAEVTLDGRPVGATPLLARRVPAGLRRVRLEHPPTGAVVELVIPVDPDQHVRRRLAIAHAP
ncbi:MAG TPA: serine/threonine-protein kinase [Thermodesulfobacteriota bacterium]